MEIGFSDEFISRVNRLGSTDVKRVWTAVDKFRQDPSHPSLNFHPIQGDTSRRLHSLRASDDVRVLVVRQGAVHLLVDADHHDKLYQRADRLRFVANPATGFIGLLSLDKAEHPPVHAERDALADRAGVFDRWTTTDLSDAGFDAGEIDVLRACKTEDDLLKGALDEETTLRAIEILELTPDEWRTPSLDPTADAEDRLRRAIVQHGAMAGISPLFTPDEVARIAAAPIEDWMIFLHPDQQSAAQRRYDGPARVRGSAGTGKTVVALHRAVALAKRFVEEGRSNPILFTTFIRTLPPVLEQLYLRLPGAIPGAVHFVNVDKLANKVCRDAGDYLTIDSSANDAAFASAWHRVATPDTALALSGLTRGYLRDEITAVIKGRGLRTVEEYLGVERTGRGTRLHEPLRRQVWELGLEWDRQMAQRGSVDFADVVIRARDYARALPSPQYAAAIVDEAQDLSLAGLQLVRALVNGPDGLDRPDGLLLVGDGAQRIYPGGFTLRQAGVEVRGRTTVLRRNYRNRPEIVAAAMAVAGDRLVDDLGDQYKRGEAEALPVRSSGLKPILVVCGGLADEVRYISQRLRDLVDRRAVSYGDAAVCAATNQQVAEVRALLEETGIPTQPLDRYEGKPTNQVKLGTHHRAKGLEFKLVFLPRLGENEFPRKRPAGQSDDEYSEEISRSISQLFVAMTRARDGLVLLASAGPSSALANGIEHFEIVES